MATTTIRVETDTRDRSNQLACGGACRLAGSSRAVREADDRALLEAAGESWRRTAEEEALARYRAEAGDLSGFDGRLPDE